MTPILERPNTILESIESSFQEIKEYKEGNNNLQSLSESLRQWEKWSEQEDND